MTLRFISQDASRAALAALAAALAMLSLNTAAQTGGAYVRDAQGGLVRNSNVGDARIGNLCWRTGYWTPAQALRECDVDLFPVRVESEPHVRIPPAEPGPFTVISEPGSKITFSAEIFFDFDKSVIKPQGKTALDGVLVKLRNVDLEIIIVIGHTDGIGSDTYNNKLSVRRGEAVKAYLVSKGIEPDRVYVEGKGKREPIADNKRAEGRAQNRRVEIEAVGTPR